MPIEHERLIEIMKKLNYSHVKGACAGVAEMGVNAFLCGDLASYVDRLKMLNNLDIDVLIKKKNAFFNEVDGELKSLTSDKQNDKLLVDILAFFEGVELYLLPLRHSDFFNRSVPQSATPVITPYVQSQALEKQGGRVEVGSLIGIYNKNELEEWFDSLNEAILANPPANDFALSLESDNHRISLCFSAATNRWTLIDANCLSYLENPFELKKLPNLIFKAFSDKNNTAFSTRIITTGDKKDAVKKIIDTWMENPKLKKLQEITEEKAQRYTERNGSLAYLAARDNDHKMLTQLITLKADLNKANNNGATPAHIAAQNGQVDALRVLAENKVDLDKATNDGTTPAYIAAQNGQVDALRVLAEYKANLDKATNDGWTPALIAAQEGQVDALRVLAENKADLDKANNNGTTPAFIAAQKGLVDALRVLAAYKANLDKANNDGWTPALIAAAKGQVDALRVLAAYKADLDKARKDGTTPAFIAAHQGQVDALRVLAENKADLDKANNNGTTPALIAAVTGQVAALRVLAENNVDLDKANKDGLTVANVAAHFKHLSVLSFLDELKKRPSASQPAVSTSTSNSNSASSLSSTSSIPSSSSNSSPKNEEKVNKQKIDYSEKLNKLNCILETIVENYKNLNESTHKKDIEEISEKVQECKQIKPDDTSASSKINEMLNLLLKFYDKKIDDMDIGIVMKLFKKQKSETEKQSDLINLLNSKPNDHHFIRMICLIFQEKKEELNSLCDSLKRDRLPHFNTPVIIDNRYKNFGFGEKSNLKLDKLNLLKYRIKQIINYYQTKKKSTHEADAKRLEESTSEKSQDAYDVLLAQWQKGATKYGSQDNLIKTLNNDPKNHSYLRMIGYTLQDMGYLEKNKMAGDITQYGLTSWNKIPDMLENKSVDKGGTSYRL